jgi:hypothetical protein
MKDWLGHVMKSNTVQISRAGVCHALSISEKMGFA